MSSYCPDWRMEPGRRSYSGAATEIPSLIEDCGGTNHIEGAGAELRGRAAHPPWVGDAYLRTVIERIGVMSLVLFVLLSSSCSQTLWKPTEAMPPLVLTPASQVRVADRRARFREILCEINEDHGSELPDYRPCEALLHPLPNGTSSKDSPVNTGRARLHLRIAIIAGVGAACLGNVGQPFSLASAHLRSLGYTVFALPIGALSSTKLNGRQIRDALLALDTADDQPLVIIGYSKGSVDILEALANFPELSERVAAMVSIAGAVNGSPLADRTSSAFLEALAYLPGGECEAGDLGAIDSLRRDERMLWMSTHSLPDQIRYYSIAAFAAREQVSSALRGFYDDLSRIEPRNDGQLIHYDQIIAGSDLLAYFNADHWAIALPVARIHPLIGSILVDRNAFPREIVLEAVAKQVEEDLLKANDPGIVQPQESGSVDSYPNRASVGGKSCDGS